MERAKQLLVILSMSTYAMFPIAGQVLQAQVPSHSSSEPASQGASQEIGPSSAHQQQQPEYQIDVESPLVLLDVLVTDEDGNVLSGLKKGNFRVLDNGKPQVITDRKS